MNKFAFLTILLLVLVSQPSHSQQTYLPVGQSSGWTLVFADEFNGTSIDLSKWGRNWYGTTDSSITGPINAAKEKSCYDPTLATEANGELKLMAVARSCLGYTYASGMLHSNGKFNFTYGYFEARMWTPAGQGMWPAFWATGQTWPQDGEIDVLEAYGTDYSAQNFHYLCGQIECLPGSHMTLTGATSGWHTYAADWEPGVITWYYDGHQVWQWTTGVTSSPIYLILNMGLNLVPSAVPASLRVDYVRVWKKPTMIAASTPTISAIANRTINRNTSTGALGFTVADAETASTSLKLSATSSDTTTVPVSNVTFGGSGSNRTVTVTPLANRSGIVTITVTVSDGTLTASRSFAVTIHEVNVAPTISTIANRSTNEDTSTGTISFTVGDAETLASSLTLSATSSDISIVPVSNITFGGSGSNRTVTIMPSANKNGTVTITATVNDGFTTASSNFVLTINPVNDAPTIGNIPNQSTYQSTATLAIPFSVGDVETPAASLTLTRASTNTTLVPVNNIILGGSGSSRTVTIMPAANQAGTATITLTVSDGALTASRSFVLTVTAIADALFSDSFESGNLSAWTLSSIDNNNLSVTSNAALVGSFGLQAVINDANQMYVNDDTPTAEPRYRVRFKFDPNSVVMANSDLFTIFYATQGPVTSILQVQLRFASGSYQLRTCTLLDDVVTWACGGWATISDAPHLVELDWRAATLVGANNGTLTLWVDQVQQTPVSALDNDTRRIDGAWLGVLAGIDPGTHGTIYFDGFVSRRFTYIGP